MRERLGIVTVPHFLHLFLVDYFFFDWLQLEGTYGDHLEVAAALRAGNDFAFFNVVLINIEIGLAFWTINHDGLRAVKSAPVNI
jgi:hypothetical protein